MYNDDVKMTRKEFESAMKANRVVGMVFGIAFGIIGMAVIILLRLVIYG